MKDDTPMVAWVRFLRAAGLKHSGRCRADGSLELIPIR